MNNKKRKHMKNPVWLLTTIIVVLFLRSGSLLGQATFQFTIQTWGTYTTYDHYDWNADSSALDLTETTTQLGVGIRRARLRGKMTKGKASAFVQVDGPSGDLLDAQIDYSLTDNLKLRMGRFVGAGSQAGGNTSHTAIDFAERSIVGRLWASSVGRSDYRTYGTSLIGKYNNFNYQVMAHNGDGHLNIKPYGTKSSKSDEDTGVMPQLDFAVSTKLGNGLSTGLHYGLPNENRINVSSATGFLYLDPKDYSSGKLRGKLDFTRVVNHEGESDVVSLGYALKGFYKLHDKMEVGAGYEQWDPNTDVDTDSFGNIVVGVNYSPNPEHWKDTLFKLVATFKTSEVDNEPLDPLMVHLVWQVYMH